MFLALAVTALVLEMAAVWAATTTAWRTTNSIRVMLARHVLGLDHEFHRTHTPGELIQRVDGDVTSVSDFLGQVVPKAVGAAFLTIGTLTVLTVLGSVILHGITATPAMRSLDRRHGRLPEEPAPA